MKLKDLHKMKKGRGKEGKGEVRREKLKISRSCEITMVGKFDFPTFIVVDVFIPDDLGHVGFSFFDVG